MGATPRMNRSAKDGARSSPHYGGEGVSHSPIVPRCLLTARYGRFTRDPRRPACVPAQSRVSDPISESEVGSDMFFFPIFARLSRIIRYESSSSFHLLSH